MAKLKCPGCGGWYDGKKCRSCLYVHFEEEEKHDHHHGIYGEPSPPSVSPEPTPVAFPRMQEKRTAPVRGKKKTGGTKLLPIVLIPLLLSIVTSMFEFVMDATDAVDSILDGFVEETEASVSPDAQLLYEGEGFRLLSPWQQGDPIEGNIDLVLENDTDCTLTVSSTMAAVNGVMMEDVFFYGSAEAGGSAEATLWMDMETLEQVGIDAVEDVVLCICAYDAETYETLEDDVIFALKTGETAVFSPEVPDGISLYEDTRFSLCYVGARDLDDGSCEFWFYSENRTNSPVSLSSSNVTADGTVLDAYLWQDLLPQSRGFCSVWVPDPASLGIESVAALQALEFSVGVAEADTWETIFETDLLQVPVTP